MIKIVSTGEMDNNRKKLSDKIVNRVNEKFDFNIMTIESSQLSELIFNVLKEENVQC